MEEVVEISIRCMYTNACSVIGKMDELSIQASNYDIIGITKTFGSCDISDAELSLPGFQMFRVDRGTRGVREI